MSISHNIALYTFPSKSEPQKEIVVNLYYNLAKTNYVTAKPEQRGYYLSAQPIEKFKTDGGINFVRFGAYTGTHLLIKPAKSYSASELTRLAAYISKEKVKKLVDWVIANNNFSPEDYDLKEIS